MLEPTTRRNLLCGAGAFAGAVAAAGCAATGGERTMDAEEDVSPAEDLMREHGLLNRILLVYEEGIRRIEREQDLDVRTIGDAAAIVRTFVEDYHERLEEEHLFPRFEEAGVLVDLVATLRRQHDAGRRVTAAVVDLVSAASASDASARPKLAESLRSFIRMYRPHEAREDTVLFPAFRGVVSAREWDELGEQFEDKEHELFGAEGFEGMVARVAGIERALGIDDLAKFTPS